LCPENFGELFPKNVPSNHPDCCWVKRAQNVTVIDLQTRREKKREEALQGLLGQIVQMKKVLARMPSTATNRYLVVNIIEKLKAEAATLSKAARARAQKQRRMN
jgi:hypothetical protein